MSAAWLGENWPAVAAVAGGLYVFVLFVRRLRTDSGPFWRIPELRALVGYVAWATGILLDRPGVLDDALWIVGGGLWVWGMTSIGRRNRLASAATSGDDAGRDVARR